MSCKVGQECCCVEESSRGNHCDFVVMHINGVYISECHMGLLRLWECDCNVA